MSLRVGKQKTTSPLIRASEVVETQFRFQWVETGVRSELVVK